MSFPEWHEVGGRILSIEERLSSVERKIEESNKKLSLIAKYFRVVLKDLGMEHSSEHLRSVCGKDGDN